MCVLLQRQQRYYITLRRHGFPRIEGFPLEEKRKKRVGSGYFEMKGNQVVSLGLLHERI